MKKKSYVKYWKIELIRRIHDKVGQFQKDDEY